MCNLNYKFLQLLKDLPYIQEIWLFGSRARGDNDNRADIDLAIICPESTSKEWYEILKIIEDADTLLKIDCVRFDSLADNDKLKQNIIMFHKVLFKRQ